VVTFFELFFYLLFMCTLTLLRIILLIFILSFSFQVPEGHTFRGYPIVVNDSSPANVLGVFRRAQIATDILRTRGDAVRFALRVKVFSFPEDVKAIWVMLACKFKP